MANKKTQIKEFPGHPEVTRKLKIYKCNMQYFISIFCNSFTDYEFCIRL